MTDERVPTQVVIVGAGPGGLTAARELVFRGVAPVILEKDDVVGGISRTVVHDGWRFDIGGHRFFTKVGRVEAFWRSVLSEEDFLVRPRMSRIFYKGRFFDYPLRAGNALTNLGIVEAARCVASYLAVRIRPPVQDGSFETWVASRFGWRLYRIFFKTYTEKVWGMPAREIRADWAAQRIKNLSLFKAIINSIRPPGRKPTDITSLIEEFRYPKFGPGMMWERCAENVVELGGQVLMNRTVVRLMKTNTRRVRVVDHEGFVHDADHVISTMPIGQLIHTLEPIPPAEVIEAASRLRHRDFLTVSLVVPQEVGFPDNWIYVHDPDVHVGRIQNFGSWSPFMVRDSMTCLGLEYFVNVGDEIWSLHDDDLVVMAEQELRHLGLIDEGAVEAGYVVRMPMAYPVYDATYAEALSLLRDYLEREWSQVHVVGRNGMHRYNNQDHSMLTAMLTVDNLMDSTNHDVWSVNVDEEYHEEIRR